MQTEDQMNQESAAGMEPVMREKTFQAEVTEEYIAEDDSQLTIKVGQIVYIYGEGEDQNGWFYGYYTTPDGSTAQGYLPSTYVTPLKNAEDSISKHDPLQNYGPASAFGGGDSQPYKIEHDSIDQPMIGSSGPRSGDDLVPAPDVDPTTVLNTYTKYIEWLAAIILFLSGCLCIAHGTATSKALGSIQIISSIPMILYLYFKREAFSESPAILRAGIWFIASIFAWTAPPAGLLGGMAATMAMGWNVYCHLNDSGPADAPYFWDELIDEFGTLSLFNYGVMLAWALLNVCVLFGGRSYGNNINKTEFGGLIDQMEGIAGCGFIVSFNLMCMLFMNCRYIIEMLTIQVPIPFLWLYENYIGINYALFATITIATIGHIFAAMDAYNSSYASAFSNYYGGAPLGVGVIVFGLLIQLWALMIRPNLFWRGPEEFIFKWAYKVGYPLIVILLFFYGKGGWSDTYWKWMITPCIFFVIDRVMQRNTGGQS